MNEEPTVHGNQLMLLKEPFSDLFSFLDGNSVDIFNSNESSTIALDDISKEYSGSYSSFLNVDSSSFLDGDSSFDLLSDC